MRSTKVDKPWQVQASMSWLGPADIGTIGISSHPSPAIRHGTLSRCWMSTAELKTGRAHQTPRAADPAKIMRYRRLESRSFFRAMAAEWDLPQRHIVSSNGRRDLPRGVMAYTTRGGVSAYTVRSTIPALCRSRSCWESVRCVIPEIERFSSENRLVPWKSCSSTAAFQRPPTIRAVVSTGQSSGRLIMLGVVPHCIPRIACVSRIPM